MERHFENDLNELKERLLWMGSLAERAVHQAFTPCWMPTSNLAKRVLKEEDAINELQMEIDDRVVQLLALHQLMAADLRFVLAVSRINNDLERIGDQAVNIAPVRAAHPAPPAREAIRGFAAHERTGRRASARQPERGGAPRRGTGAEGAVHATTRWIISATRFSANC